MSHAAAILQIRQTSRTSRTTGDFTVKGLLIALGATLTLALGASSASAADLHVETTGTDSPTCGTSIITACLTIGQATTNAVSGDRVLIGSGLFVVSATINPGNKSIEYIGNGPSNTEVSGGDSNTFAQNGIFRFQFNGTTASVKDMTLSHFPKVTSASANRFAIQIQPSLPAPVTLAYAINATIDNVRFVGNTGTPLNPELAVYSAANAGSLTISNSDLDNVMGNSILLEQHMGPATITGNTIDKPLSSSGAVILDMTHANSANTQAYNVTGKLTVSGNTVTAGTGIQVLAGWPFTSGFGPSAFLGGVEISDNTVNTTTSTGSAISLINATNANDGTPGRILDAVISGNTLQGTGPGVGIGLQGGIPDPEITGNNIRNRSSGILLNRHTRTAAPNPGTFDHHPTGTVASGNQIVDNTSGVTTDAGISIDANLNGNWWGCNEGPAIGASPPDADCDSVSTADSSAITLTNWVVLGISAVPPSALSNQGSATVTAGFDKLNTNAAAPAVFEDGTILPMGATAGSLSDNNPTLSSGVATTTFTSNAATGRSATATFDHESVTHQWDDDTTAPDVTITSPANGTQTTDASIVVNYTVTDFGGDVECDLADGASVPLDFGPNTITVSCEDGAGNIGTDSVTVTRIDVTPPDVTITSPANGLITNASSVTLSFTVDDDTDVTCNYDDGDTVNLNPGVNSITVVCTDEFGNVGFDSVSVIRDNTPPSVTIVTPANGLITNATSTVLNYSVINDYGTVSCDIADGATVPLVEGENTIEVECTDQAGNVGSDSVTVTRDTIPPDLTITAPTNGSTTTDPTTTLSYTVTDATATVCAPDDGDAIPLNYGSNTISVVCTDAAGNTTTESVTVSRISTVPPVVSITSPANGAIINAGSTTVTYVAASDHGTVTCTPPSGGTVPLAIGINTITVNCVDSFGNTASASVTVYRPDTLPSCAKDVVITSVYRVGSKTRIIGRARLQYIGQKVKLQYMPSGSKTIATPVVKADGTFSVNVNRPSRPAYTSNNARYRAILNNTSTIWVKLTRRMGRTSITYDGNGRLSANGSVSLPIAKGQPLRVERSDACGKYRQIGWLPVRSNGDFNGSVPTGGGSATAVNIRLRVQVAKASNPSYRFNTYSIVQPVIVDR